MEVGKKYKIGIVGLGLIGGSLAIALSKNHYIIGKDTSSETIDFCLKHGYINSSALKFSDFVGCDVIFVCVPVDCVQKTCVSVYQAVGEGSIITDVASVKGMLSTCPGRIVGGHPMAGTEFSGIKAAKPDLFCGAPYYLVKYSATTSADFTLVKTLLQTDLQCVVAPETFENHDKIVSKTSHLPHMIAYSLASYACGVGSKNSGKSLKDTTRIAASDPKFWTSVAMLNKKNILQDLDNFILQLQSVKALIAEDNFVMLQYFLEQAREKKLNSL